jgi:hypothetical protein
MSYFKVDDPEALVECPYNKAHMVRNRRMQYHLIDCRKQNTGQEMKVCPYNAKHVHPSAEHQYHLVHCYDRVIIDRDIVHSAQERYECIPDRPKGNTSVPAYSQDVHIEPDEDWDSDACAEPFTLANAMAFAKPKHVSQLSATEMRLPRENPHQWQQQQQDLELRRQPRLCNGPPLQLTKSTVLQGQQKTISAQSGVCNTTSANSQLTATASLHNITNISGLPVSVIGRGRAIALITQTVPSAEANSSRPAVVRQATATPAFTLSGVGHGSHAVVPPNARDLPLPAFGRSKCSALK